MRDSTAIATNYSFILGHMYTVGIYNSFMAIALSVFIFAVICIYRVICILTN